MGRRDSAGFCTATCTSVSAVAVQKMPDKSTNAIDYGGIACRRLRLLRSGRICLRCRARRRAGGLICSDECVALDAPLKNQSGTNPHTPHENNQARIWSLLNFEICVVAHRRKKNLVSWT